MEFKGQRNQRIPYSLHSLTCVIVRVLALAPCLVGDPTQLSYYDNNENKRETTSSATLRNMAQRQAQAAILATVTDPSLAPGGNIAAAYRAQWLESSATQPHVPTHSSSMTKATPAVLPTLSNNQPSLWRFNGEAPQHSGAPIIQHYIYI